MNRRKRKNSANAQVKRPQENTLDQRPAPWRPDENAEVKNQPRLRATFFGSSVPVGVNPYFVDDPRYKVWEKLSVDMEKALWRSDVEYYSHGGIRQPSSEGLGRYESVTGSEVERATSKKNKKNRHSDPEVQKRKALVKCNPHVSAVEMCEIFDRQHVLLPAKWQHAGFRTWCKTYRNSTYRKRIHVLIAKDRSPG
jgi:hypothetical protein